MHWDLVALYNAKVDIIMHIHANEKKISVAQSLCVNKITFCTLYSMSCKVKNKTQETYHMSPDIKVLYLTVPGRGTEIVFIRLPSL